MKNKEKYDIRHLTFHVSRYKNGIVKAIDIYHDAKRIEKIKILGGACITQSINAIGNWLEEEYVPEILTEREKAYLSAVIKPFRKDVEWIERMDNSFVNGNQHQFLCISLTNDYCCLPLFKKDTMYKGMEVNKRYTLEELGL